MTPLSDKPTNSPEQSNKVEEQLTKYDEKYGWAAWGWVAVYRTLVIASAVLSASAAVVVNLKEPAKTTVSLFGQPLSRSDVVSVLAASSTLMTTILGALGLEENWRANRQARDRVRQLKLELIKKNPDYDLIISKLQETINDRISDSLNKKSSENLEESKDK